MLYIFHSGLGKRSYLKDDIIMEFTWDIAQESVLVPCSLLFLQIICIEIWAFCTFYKKLDYFPKALRDLKWI